MQGVSYERSARGSECGGRKTLLELPGSKIAVSWEAEFP